LISFRADHVSTIALKYSLKFFGQICDLADVHASGSISNLLSFLMEHKLDLSSSSSSDAVSKFSSKLWSTVTPTNFALLDLVTPLLLASSPPSHGDLVGILSQALRVSVAVAAADDEGSSSSTRASLSSSSTLIQTNAYRKNLTGGKRSSAQPDQKLASTTSTSGASGGSGGEEFVSPFVFQAPSTVQQSAAPSFNFSFGGTPVPSAGVGSSSSSGGFGSTAGGFNTSGFVGFGGFGGFGVEAETPNFGGFGGFVGFGGAPGKCFIFSVVGFICFIDFESALSDLFV
jgi:hypothetical protein